MKRSNTGEGDTLTSCMCYHGYKASVHHPFLVDPPNPTLDILAFKRQRKDTKGAEKMMMKVGKDTDV